MTARLPRLVQALGAAWLLTLAACSSYERPKPTPLETFTPRIAGKQVWSRSVGEPVPGGALVAVRERVVLATRKGLVLVLDAAGGAERERYDAGAALSAGVGSDGKAHAVVTESNDLVVFEAGRERWRVRLGSRVVTPPLVAGERVFVQGVDRVIEAFDATDGRPLWRLQRQGEPLSLAQPGVLQPYKDTLLAGYSSRMLWIDPLLGKARNEVSMASPRGTNEVERLSDLVGPAARVGETVCARAFQSAVACVNAERATMLWSRNFGGYQGVAADTDYVFAADASDRITAWKRATGDLAWTSERLRYRVLSAPLALGGAVAFGDVEGQMHFLSPDKGETLQRLPTDGSPINVPPVRAGQTVIAHTQAGALYAFRPE